ncbi:MAG: ABC transporter ATP-binding protein [Erysipelotrichaceae bacterium]
MGNVVEIKNLVKKYKDLTAVNNLNITIKQGEIFGLLGPNGCGKSTTISCILSLLKYESGTINLFEKPMKPEAYDIKAKIGVVFQEVAVIEELNVIENIDYFCGLYITNKKQRQQYVQDAIALVSLEEFTKFKPKQLSGGLLRRLNIACGIAHKPTLVILDEPTVAVDPQSRNAILEGIRELNKKGATIIYTTHYMDEVEQLCDRIVIMDKGEIKAEGTKEELKALITTSEIITIDTNQITEQNIKELETKQNIKTVEYRNEQLKVTYQGGTLNISHLLEYLTSKKMSYTKIYSELPTLNDVFLELTGKELRD